MGLFGDLKAIGSSAIQPLRDTADMIRHPVDTVKNQMDPTEPTDPAVPTDPNDPNAKKKKKKTGAPAWQGYAQKLMSDME